MSIGSELVVVLVLVLLNGIFAGAEIAILSVRKTRLRELAEEGSRAARALLSMRERPEPFLATIQVGITVVAATAAAFGGVKVARALAGVFERMGLGERSENAALAIVVAVISFLSIVFGELVPKSLALRGAERYSLVVALPLRALSALARPLVWLLTASSNAVLRFFDDETTFTEARLSKDELQQLVDEAAVTGSVERSAGDIAYRALDFGDVRVGAVMVPRPDMVTIGLDATREEIRDVLLREPHLRFPVRGGMPEDVVGYVTSRDLVRSLLGREPETVVDVVRPARFVTEAALAADVLREMQSSREHLALVVDETGTVVGLVTIEDLVEELVGEIFAEHETPVERMRREPDGSVVVRGRVPVHEINRELGIDLPEGASWTTMAGLATALAGSIPRAGARVQAGPVVIEIVEATDRRVLSVRIEVQRRPRSPATAH